MSIDIGREYRERCLCIVRNIRRNHSTAWNKRTKNWVLVMEHFGFGSNSSCELCEIIGIDPEKYVS